MIKIVVRMSIPILTFGQPNTAGWHSELDMLLVVFIETEVTRCLLTIHRLMMRMSFLFFQNENT